MMNLKYSIVILNIFNYNNYLFLGDVIWKVQKIEKKYFFNIKKKKNIV
jgi:hypothetical protein